MKLVLYFLFTITMCSCFKKEEQSDIDSVKKVVLDFQDDFNDGSFINAEKYTTTDWEHINPGGGLDIGREATLRTVRAVHQSFLKNVSMRLDSMNVRFITPEVALVTAFHSIDNYTTPDSIMHVNERHIKSYVVIKQSGKWLLTLDHNTIIR